MGMKEILADGVSVRMEPVRGMRETLSGHDRENIPGGGRVNQRSWRFCQKEKIFLMANELARNWAREMGMGKKMFLVAELMSRTETKPVKRRGIWTVLTAPLEGSVRGGAVDMKEDRLSYDLNM